MITLHPLTIGRLELRNNLIAAPMAGLSSLPYRLLAMECGCALAISEMISAEGTIRAHARTRRYFVNDQRARPFGAQLFGADPDSMAAAISSLGSEPIDLIDINMGCPVKKVVSKGAGSALMRTPTRAEKLISAARAATKLPLTVKIRAGWDEKSINCVEIARIAEASGADAVTVHARTRSQEFKGRADWRLISEVKSAIKIPVIGNGDIRTRPDADRLVSETGCDGIMIGRAAVGNPWIFGRILGTIDAEPTPAERRDAALRHMDMLCELLGERMAVFNMRTILPWYGKGIRGIRHLMQQCHKISSAAELKLAINEFFATLPT